MHLELGLGMKENVVFQNGMGLDDQDRNQDSTAIVVIC